MLNAIGLENIGVDTFVEEKLPFLQSINTAVILNIYGRNIEEYGEMAQRVNDIEGIAGVELNISCPNVKEGGITFGTDAKQVDRIVSAVRKVVKKCLLVVKLSPNVTDILEPAHAAIEAGADCLSLVNTFTSLAIA